VSRIVPQKGLELLLKILPKFVGRNDLQFIFVGDGKKKLLEEIKKLRDHFAKKIAARLKADFEFPHQVFAGADFLVLPSVAEPFGMVVAEAKKYGVVPIVHLVDGLKDQVKDGQNGFGFQKYQVNQLEEKLYQALRVWQREWQLKRLGDWTRLEDWFTVSRKWLEVLYG
jgi:starch synthase